MVILINFRSICWLNTDKYLWYLHVKALRLLEVTASGAAPSDTETEKEKKSSFAQLSDRFRKKEKQWQNHLYDKGSKT